MVYAHITILYYILLCTVYFVVHSNYKVKNGTLEEKLTVAGTEHKKICEIEHIKIYGSILKYFLKFRVSYNEKKYTQQNRIQRK